MTTTTTTNTAQRSGCSDAEKAYCERTSCQFCAVDVPGNIAQCGGAADGTYVMQICSSNADCPTNMPRCGSHDEATYCFTPGLCPRPGDVLISSTTSSSSSDSSSIESATSTSTTSESSISTTETSSSTSVRSHRSELDNY